MQALFNPKTIAVVGASNKPGKIGFAIMKNILHYHVHRKLFPINIDSSTILGIHAYKFVKDIPIEELDLCVICVPKQFVLQVLKDCAKKKTKFAIIISAGFKETGDLKSELEIKEFAKKNKIRIIGPNVLGLYDCYNKLDTLFLPIDYQPRPRFGKVSLLSQSGTVGAILLEQFEKKNLGLNKFISYGNACDINECDLIEELNKDENTDIIAAYIEEVIDGKRFIEILRKQKKPLIILKSGKSKKGSQSVQSHTGNLAGDYSVYNGIFNQFNVVSARSVTELVGFAQAHLLKKIKNTIIITNGGGYGILLSDHFEENNIPILDLTDKQKSELQKVLPLGVGLKNPIDIMGDSDAERYITVINKTKSYADTYVIVLLGQTSTIDEVGVHRLKTELEKLNKNIVFISTVDKYTKMLQDKFLVYEFPEQLAKSISCNVIKEKK